MKQVHRSLFCLISLSGVGIFSQTPTQSTCCLLLLKLPGLEYKYQDFFNANTQHHIFWFARCCSSIPFKRRLWSWSNWRSSSTSTRSLWGRCRSGALRVHSWHLWSLLGLRVSFYLQNWICLFVLFPPPELDLCLLSTPRMRLMAPQMPASLFTDCWITLQRSTTYPRLWCPRSP